MPVSLATASTASGAVLATDKDDYAPGDTLKLSGWGWQAGDTLDLHLDLDPQNHPPVDWTVVPGSDGRFWDSNYVVQDSDEGVTFSLTATSRGTGESATAVFFDFTLKDAYINSVSPSTTVSSNGSFTITAGATRTTTGSATNPTWAGTSYAFSTTNSAPSSGYQCISPAAPNPSVAVSATASPGTSGGSMTIPATGLARGTQYLFIKAEASTTCNGSASAASAGQQLTVQGPDLAITKTHTAADFVRGANANYTMKVQNVGEVATSGTITVVDNGLPNNLTALSISGTNWTCTLATLTCTRSTALAASAFADDITLSVAVGKAGNANVTNTATVSNAGDYTTGNNTASDPTTLIDAPATHLTITSAAFTAAVNTCSSAATVQTRNQFNQPVRPNANIQVNLSSTSGSGSFYATAGCGGSPITSVTIPSTDFAVNFYYKDSSCGTPTLKAKDNNTGTGSLGEDTQPETINGCASNTAPTVDAGGPYTVAEGTQLTLAPTVTDPDAGDVLTYKWSIAYTTAIDAGGACTFDDNTKKDAKITCTDDSNNGTFTLTLEVKDGAGGHTVTDDATLTVTNANPTGNADVEGNGYSGNEGAAIALSGSKGDPGSNDTHTYSWSYAPVSGVDAGATCSFTNGTTLTPSIACTDDGTFKVTLTVTDDDGDAGSADATLTLANVAPTANADVDENGYSGNEGGAIALKGSKSDPGSNDTHTYSWSYAAVSGVDAGATCSFTNGTTLTPSISCTDDGVFKVTLTVTDDDGGSDSDDATLTLANVAPTANADADGNGYSGNEGAAITLKGSKTDPGSNDTHTYSWSYSAVSGVDAGATCSFTNGTTLTPSISCTDDGTFKVTLTVTDDDGGSDSDDATLTVANVAPTMSISAPGDYSVWSINAPEFGSQGFVSASFSDVGTNDTHGNGAGSCKINWGDGDPVVDGVVAETPGSGTGTCKSAAGNPYTDDGAGIYYITVTVTDDDGGQVSASRTIVVYDPSAGFVTGGGWINSPTGAYFADPSLTGKANFGFVSKYQKGASVPTGNTEFQFQAGNLNFHSDTYDWLVVNQNGLNAQFKGNGIINGQGCSADREGKCRFMLWAYDGTKNGGYDTFRIEIWTEDSGGTKHDVYDNGGSGSGGFSNTTIGGGSIQVQTGKK